MPAEAAPDLLDDLVGAVEAGEHDRAGELLRELLATYDDARRRESRLTARAALARARTDGDDRETVDRFLGHASTVTMRRGGFLVTAGAYLQRPDELDADPLTEGATELADRESTFVAVADEFAGVADAQTLPARPVLAAVSYPNGTATGGFPVTATVGNAGDEAAAGVELAASGAGDLTVDPASRTRDSLAPDATAELSFTATVGSEGAYRLALELTSETVEGATDERFVPVPMAGGGGPLSAVPDWAPAAGGAGLLGLGGLAGYRYFTDSGEDGGGDD